MSINTEYSPIRSWTELERGLERIDQLMHVEASDPEWAELQVLVARVEAYEAKHFPIDPPNWVTRVKFRMENGGYGFWRRAWMWAKRNDLAIIAWAVTIAAIIGMGVVLYTVPMPH